MTTTAEIESKLRERAAALLSDGTVGALVGWEAGRFGPATPLVCFKPEDAGRLVFNEGCANTLAKYALDLKDRGKVGLCARGCESRAVNRMIQDNQLSRDAVYILGIPCPQMKDPQTGEVLAKCAACQHRNPIVFDEMLGEAAEEPASDEGRYASIEAIEAMSRQERQALFDEMYSKCIRCNACRNVCPCCTCRICFIDRRDVGWQGKQQNLTENRFFGLVRSYHVCDRCIECGECERVCPMGLPLMTLTRKMVKDMNGLFGGYESGVADEGADVLGSYRLDDIEEFM